MTIKFLAWTNCRALSGTVFYVLPDRWFNFWQQEHLGHFLGEGREKRPLYICVFLQFPSETQKVCYVYISRKSPLVAPMFDFKIGFLAKLCVIEGMSEIMYIYIYIHSYRRFIMSAGYHPWGYNQRTHQKWKSRIYPIHRLGIDWWWSQSPQNSPRGRIYYPPCQ